MLSEDELRSVALKIAPIIAQELLLAPTFFGDKNRLHLGKDVNTKNTLFNLSSGHVFIENFVFFGHNVCVLTGTHDMYQSDRDPQPAAEERDVHIEQGALISSNVTIVGPCRIGRNAVVGVGSVVISDVTPGWFYAGIPAKPIKMVVSRPEIAKSCEPHRALTRDDISLAYRAVLGRNPEEAAYDAWPRVVTDFRSLIDTIALSAEAISRNAPRGAKNTYNASTQHQLLNLLQMLRVYNVMDRNKIRLGRDNDGGYVMIDDFFGVSKAYSLGISDDISWDRAIADRKIDLYQYDHTILGLPEENERFHWFRIGIEGVSTPSTDFKTLELLIEANGHKEERDLVLKCDIEGAEWEMLAETNILTIQKFKQIVLEIHFYGKLEDPSYYDLVHRAISKLTLFHNVVHVHGNNCGEYSVIAGIPLPTVIELTLFRRGPEYRFEESRETFPTELDMPCAAHLADFKLGSFHF